MKNWSINIEIKISQYMKHVGIHNWKNQDPSELIPHMWSKAKIIIKKNLSHAQNSLNGYWYGR